MWSHYYFITLQRNRIYNPYLDNQMITNVKMEDDDILLLSYHISWREYTRIGDIPIYWCVSLLAWNEQNAFLFPIYWCVSLSFPIEAYSLSGHINILYDLQHRLLKLRTVNSLARVPELRLQIWTFYLFYLFQCLVIFKPFIFTWTIIYDHYV